MKLAAKDAAALDDLIARRGFDGTAKDLHVSPALVNKLAYGGGVSAESVQRMTEALAKHALHTKEGDHGDKAAV
jgi:hypothetical protein